MSVTLPGAGSTIAAEDDGINGLVQIVKTADLSFLERICLKALSKLTFSPLGLRIDLTSQTLSTVTTVSSVTAASGVAAGRATTDGQGIQLSSLAFQTGFRRNLVIS